MKRLIVNADDFGLSEGVNRAILHSHACGIVTSTSLLANGAAFASAVAALGSAPLLSVAVHLNVSQLPPVSPPAAVPTLINARGELYLTPGWLEAGIAGGYVRLEEIEAEMRAQIRRVLDAGIQPSHLDGHMHVHVLPGVAEIAVKLAREFRIPALRCPVEPLGRLLLPGGSRWLTAVGVSALGRRLRRLATRDGIVSPAHFYGIRETGVLDAPRIRRILRTVPEGPGISELMCHPGYADTELAAVGGRLQAAERETEVQALTSPEIASLAADEGISLVSYRALGESKVQAAEATSNAD